MNPQAMPACRATPDDGAIYRVYRSPVCPAITLQPGDRVLYCQENGSTFLLRLSDNTRHLAHWCGHHVHLVREEPTPVPPRPGRPWDRIRARTVAA